MKRILLVSLGLALVVALASYVGAAEPKGEMKKDEGKTLDVATADQVKKLIFDGGNAYAIGEFTKAIDFADAALKLDPENKAAKQLKSICEEGIKDRDARIAKDPRSRDELIAVQEQRKEFQRRMQEVNKDMVAQTGILKYGPNWPFVRQRTGGVYGPAADLMEANKEIYAKLDATMVSVDFTENSLAEITKFLAQLSGLNIMADARAKVGDKAAPDAKVSFTAKNIQLRSVLEWVTRLSGTNWTVRDGVVFITDKEHMEEFKVTAVYDISDIVAAIPDYSSVPFFDIPLPAVNARVLNDGFYRAPDYWYWYGIAPYTGSYFIDYESINRYFMTEEEVKALIQSIIGEEEK